MKLIKELNEELSCLTEGSGADKKYFMEGIAMQGDIVNRNKRRYAMDVLRPEVSRYNKEFVEQKRAFGELGHPAGPTINLDRVSHMFTELREEGSNYVGRALVMDTPSGKIAKNFIDIGAKLGWSSRALGSLKMNREGINEVQNDFMLSTPGDIVADPSAPDAFVQGIMEGTEWLFNIETGSFSYKNAEQIKEIIQSTNRAQLEEVTNRLWQNFLQDISK